MEGNEQGKEMDAEEAARANAEAAPGPAADISAPQAEPEATKPEPFRVMDPSQISMIETDCKKIRDILRLDKGWGDSVIEQEANPSVMRKPPILDCPVIATFPLEDLMGFLKLVKKYSAHVKFYMGTDRPLKAEAIVKDYDETEKTVTFWLAPRIVNE
jgi:hypothetical protein